MYCLSYEWKICWVFSHVLWLTILGYLFCFVVVEVGTAINMAWHWSQITLHHFEFCVKCQSVHFLAEHTQTASIVMWGVLFSFMSLLLCSCLGMGLVIGIAWELPHIGIDFFLFVCEKQVCLVSASGFVLDPHFLQSQEQGNLQLGKIYKSK
jgi:hypothetical protein